MIHIDQWHELRDAAQEVYWACISGTGEPTGEQIDDLALAIEACGGKVGE